MSKDTKSVNSSLQYSVASLLHLLRRVPPGECGFTSSDGDPGTNGVIKKLAAELSIKAESPILQAQLRVLHSTLKQPASTIGTMKNPVTLALLLILTSALDFVQAAATATQEDKHVEEEIRRLNGEEVDAFLHKDPQPMARVWSDDFVVTNPLNKFVTKQQVLGMMESGFLVITSLDREIEYLRVYGDIVIVAGRETVVWGGKMPNAGKTEHLRFTAVWMKQAGKWQEIARHANIVPAQQPASSG
jgi:uncharacterized protein (TIGR02246 family)